MKKPIVLAGIVLLSILTMQFALPGAAIIKEFAHKLKLNGQKFSQEKVYVHLDKQIYKPGDDIWFKAYITEGDFNLPSNKSNIIYLMLADSVGREIFFDKFVIGNGMAHGDFTLPKETEEGKYTLCAFSSWMKNMSPNSYYYKEINVSTEANPPMLLRLELEDTVYHPGNQVNAHLMAITRQGHPIQGVPFDYTVKMNTQTIHKGNGFSNEKGNASISFKIPDNDLGNKNISIDLSAFYFDYTENLSFYVPTSNNPIDLRFFPEGGSLVTGIESQIGFTATDKFGNAIDIEADLLDEQDTPIQKIKSYHLGMGRFSYTPQEGKKYKLRITAPTRSATTFALPEAKPQGMVLSVPSFQKDMLFVRVQNNLPTPQQSYDLIAHMKNSVFWYANDITSQDTLLNLSTFNFPSGIVQLTLIDHSGRPQAERLFFANKHKFLQIDVTPSKESYGPKEKVSLNIKVSDQFGRPLPANLSLAVSESNRNPLENPQARITSSLLLTSEIKGRIDQPNFYFSDHLKANMALDNLLLTHGWRTFKLEEVLHPEQHPKALYSNRDDLCGKVYKANGNPASYAALQLLNPKTWEIITTQANKDGTFNFPANEYIPIASAELILSANLFNNKNVFIVLDRDYTGDLKKELAQIINANPLITAGKYQSGETKEKAFYTNFGEGYTLLDPVDITAKRTIKFSEEDYKKKDFALEMSGEDLAPAPSNPLHGFLDVLQQVAPGFTVESGGKVIYRGHHSLTNNSGALIVLNGMPLGDDVHQLDFLTPDMIEKVNVIKSAGASLKYSSGSPGGVIEVTTKKGEKSSTNKTVKTSENLNSVKGFKVVREFYSPVYQTEEDKKSGLDIRSTLFWEPYLLIGENGEGQIEFYTSDIKETYTGTIEGLNQAGQAGNSTFSFSVN